MLVYPEQQSSSKNKDSVLFGLQLEAGRHCKGEGKQVFEENTKPSQTYKIPWTKALTMNAMCGLKPWEFKSYFKSYLKVTKLSYFVWYQGAQSQW